MSRTPVREAFLRLEGEGRLRLYPDALLDVHLRGTLVLLREG
jgi:DNA-binding GntR family transcriptional regulator